MSRVDLEDEDALEGLGDWHRGAGGVVVAVLYFGPRNLIGIMTYGKQAREGSLRVGDAAPIVNLVALDGASEPPLSDWIGEQPLVLVFGSFT